MRETPMFRHGGGGFSGLVSFRVGLGSPVAVGLLTLHVDQPDALVPFAGFSA